MRSETPGRSLTRLVADYARRVRGLVATECQGARVYSPLGIWVLLAVAALGADGEPRERLQAALGCSARESRPLLDALLDEPPPALVLALGLWTRRDVTSGAGTEWIGELPRGVQAGPMPSQEDADAWTRRSTLGLIERFTPQVDELSACLVSAVATRVSWEDPFQTVDSAQALSPASPWRDTVTLMLCSDGPPQAAIVETDQAGLVAVHAARAREGLTVICVSAGHDVPSPRVLDAAAEIAALAADRHMLPGCSLFDLPLGDGHSWSLTEQPRPAWEPGQRFEHVSRAFLPAWSVQSSLDLLGDERFGAGAACEALRTLTTVTGRSSARQDATASFDRYGFEAAAVTVTATAVSGLRTPTETGIQRTAELRFDHPFAAVAVGAIPRSVETARWVGLPVFEAWVTTPIEPNRNDPGPAHPDTSSTCEPSRWIQRRRRLNEAPRSVKLSGSRDSTKGSDDGRVHPPQHQRCR